MSTSTPNILDDRDQIEQLDQANLLGGIETLADQIKDAWDQTQALNVGPLTDIHQIVVAGMGGSGLGAHVASSALADRLSAPIIQIQDYHLPNWVNEHTAVIVTSFSGGTEEIVSCAEQAQAKQAQIAVITGGGKLLELAHSQSYPLYQMDPIKNPSSENRVALGYSIFGLLGFMVKLGLLELSQTEIEDLLTSVIAKNEACQAATPTKDNPAKTLAFELIDRKPVIVAAEHLAGVAHTATNQLNENGKIFAEFHVVPELNHHLMEGWQFPKSLATSHIFLVLQSDHYHPSTQHRMELTAEVIEKQDLDVMLIKASQDSPLTQVGELMTLFSYTSLYLAMLEQINPGPLPMVDWFKGELKKRTSS